MIRSGELGQPRLASGALEALVIAREAKWFALVLRGVALWLILQSI